MPQVVIELSTEMLNAALRNLTGRSLPCLAGQVTITDLHIDSVVPVRDDEPTEWIAKILAREPSNQVRHQQVKVRTQQHPDDVVVPVGMLFDVLQAFEHTLDPPTTTLASPPSFVAAAPAAPSHPLPRLRDAPFDVVNLGVLTQPWRAPGDAPPGLRIALDLV